MLLWLTEYLAQFDSGFNVFRYLTLRTILGVLTSLFVSFLFGPYLIRHLTKKQIGQSIRDDGPKTHLEKSGTPTMGGLLILISITFSTLCWADLNNRYVLVVLIVTLLFVVLGVLLLLYASCGRALVFSIFFFFQARGRNRGPGTVCGARRWE